MTNTDRNWRGAALEVMEETSKRLGETLDKDFAFWSSPQNATYRSYVWRVFKELDTFLARHKEPVQGPFTDDDDLAKAVAAERERCASIADTEAAEAYRNPRAASYRDAEMEQIARYTAERIATVIRRTKHKEPSHE